MRPTITRLATLVALLLLAAPLAAQAQQAGKVYNIGYLGLGSSFEGPNQAAFYRGLREHGWIEGQNFVLTTRFAQFKSERLREVVAELVQRKVDVIVVQSAEGALAAKHGTSTIPIVAVSPADAVAIGLVASVARPGGNVTGLSYLGTELVGKQIELLREAVPSLSRVAALSNPANPTHAPRLRAAAIGAQGLRIHLESIEARTPAELDKAFATMVRARVGGVLVVSDPMFSNEARRLAQLASTSGLPAIYGFRISVDAGGLMSYGPDFSDLFYRAAAYVDKILKGAKPGDLPIEQAHEVRTDHQPQGGQSAWPHHPAVAAAARRFAQSNRLPSMYAAREYVDAGGLISYGPSVSGMFRRAAAYVDKILKGAKPGDLPVEQPTKFELVINVKTAKALGLTIPPSLLLRADQVIE